RGGDQLAPAVPPGPSGAILAARGQLRGARGGGRGGGKGLGALDQGVCRHGRRTMTRKRQGVATGTTTMKSTLREGAFPLLYLSLPVALVLGAQDKPKTTLKAERFDKDPGWEGHNNRTVPKRVPLVTQDFGHSLTSLAGKSKGEIGGRVTRAAQ